jgi:dihydroorotate dehydrogenase
VNKVAPKQDEKNVCDAAEELKKKIAAIRAANRVKQGREVEVEKTLTAAKPLEQVFLRSAERRNLHQKQETDTTLKELKDIWQKFGIGVKRGATEKDLDEMQKNIEKKVYSVVKKTGAEGIVMVT